MLLEIRRISWNPSIVQRLTYPRTIFVPLVPSARDAIIAFYQSSPRFWELDDASSSVFKMAFFRGNWGVSKLVGWLGKVGLNKFVGGRRAAGADAFR